MKERYEKPVVREVRMSTNLWEFQDAVAELKGAIFQELLPMVEWLNEKLVAIFGYVKKMLETKGELK